MATRVIDDTKLNNIAVAIQAKDSGGQMTVDEMPTRIANILSLENWISRNEEQEPIYLELTTDKIASYAFANCGSLQTVDVRNVTSMGRNAFYCCSKLQNVDVRNVTSMGAYAFQVCTNLQLIDCTSCTTPPTIWTNTFASTNGSFKVVVANDAEKALFQAATNWSARANQIYTVAEIEALYGDTYENLYLQWFGHPRFDESEEE